jgi:hypothetical protein
MGGFPTATLMELEWQILIALEILSGEEKVT